MQTVSSMNTSINTTKLPAIWGKMRLPDKNTYWLVDYGAGRYETSQNIIQYLTHKFGHYNGPSYIPYDPYWGGEDTNKFALYLLDERRVDLCVCANVLNVIDDVETIRDIIKDVTKAKSWIFQIYEGDKSGNGRYTKPNCWQHNKKVSEYLWIFNELDLGEYYVKGNFITNDLSLLK